MIKIEQVFDIELPFDEAAEVENVADLTGLIEQTLRSRSGTEGEGDA